MHDSKRIQQQGRKVEIGKEVDGRKAKLEGGSGGYKKAGKNTQAGQIFGKLTAVRFIRRVKFRSIWLWKCKCGNLKPIREDCVRLGYTRSCGCIKKDRLTSHGMAFTKIYRCWAGMKKRCLNPNCRAFKNYGGRGIGICKRWLKFENFIKDMGQRPLGMSLERRNNNLGYCKSNCIWATTHEQNRNTRQNIVFTINGQRLCLTDIAKMIGMEYQTLRCRIRKYGWSFKRAVSVKTGKRNWKP